MAKFLHWRLFLGQKSFFELRPTVWRVAMAGRGFGFYGEDCWLLKCSVCCLFGRNKLLMNMAWWLGCKKIRPAVQYFCMFLFFIFFNFFILLRPILDLCIVSVVLESPRANTLPHYHQRVDCWAMYQRDAVARQFLHFPRFFYAKASVPLLVRRRRCLLTATDILLKVSCIV